MLPAALLLGLGSLLLSGLFDVLYRLAHRRSFHESSYLVVQTAVVSTVLAALGFGGVGWRLDVATAGLGVLAGVVGITTGWTYLYAMGRGPASVTAAVRRLNFVVTGGLALIFLGERLSLIKVSAIVLAGVALIVMGTAGSRLERPHPVIYVTVVMAGLMAFMHKLAAVAGVSPAAFLICQSLTAHLSAHVMCYRSGGYALDRWTFGYAAATGTTVALAMTLGVYALRHGDAVVVAPLLQLGFLVTAPVSFLVLGEQPSRRKLSALLIAASAVVLFAREL